MTKRLKRTVQCAKCPWKVSTDPTEIPRGYSVEKHKALAGTIAEPGTIMGGDTLRIMACHEHDSTEQVHCVGWLHHQLGAGNNIALRIDMIDCENIRDLKIIGEQHACFEDTLPED